MRQSLLEAQIINTDTVETFAHSFDRSIHAPQGRDWMYRRLRQIILNSSDNILTPLGAHQIPPNAPDYIRAAAERGEQVYEFNYGSPRPGLVKLLDDASIIIDYINGVYATATMEVDAANLVQNEEKRLSEKALEKLSKMTWSQAMDAADQWARRLASRTSKMSKDGGEVIMQWPDGFYAIRFTDKQTMMRDGGQLGNCLAHGTYWDQVANGAQMVVAIRRPTDEAVVGLRFDVTGKKIFECKGKNNKPITSNYVQYVVDLLTSFQTGNKNADLEAAGINFNASTGAYGTFKDIARIVYNKNGVKVYETDSSGVIEYKKRDVLNYTLNDGLMNSVWTAGDQLTPTQYTELLNIVGRDGTPQVQNNMAAQGIYSKDGKWGSVSSVGRRIGEYSVRPTLNATVYEIGSKANGTLVLLYDNGKEGRFAMTDGNIVSGNQLSAAVGAPIMAAIFNDAGLRGDDDFEDAYLHAEGWARTSTKKYENVLKTKPLTTFNIDDQAAPLYKVPGRSIYLQQAKLGQFATLRVSSKGTVDTEVSNNIANKYERNIVEAVRYLFSQGVAKRVEDPSRYGITDEVTVVSNRDQLPNKGEFKQMADLGDVADLLEQMPDEQKAFMPFWLIAEHDSQNCQTYLNTIDRLGLFTPAMQRKWVKALRPKKAFDIRHEKDASFAGLKVVEYRIAIPDMLMHMYSQGMFTDPQAEEAVKKIRAAIEEKVEAFFDKNEGHAIYHEEGSNWPFRDFGEAIQQQNRAMAAKIQEHKNKIIGDKGVSVSDKFAALNTLHRIDKKA